MPRGMGAVVGWEIIDPLYYGRYGYPHASWAWLRRHAPVAWFEPPGMLPFWARMSNLLLEFNRTARLVVTLYDGMA